MDVLVVDAGGVSARLVRLLQVTLQPHRFAVRGVGTNELSGPWEPTTSLLVLSRAQSPPLPAALARRVTAYCENGGRLWAVGPGAAPPPWNEVAGAPCEFSGVAMEGEVGANDGENAEDAQADGSGWALDVGMASQVILSARPGGEPLSIGIEVGGGGAAGGGGGGLVVLHGLDPGTFPTPIESRLMIHILGYLGLPTAAAMPQPAAVAAPVDDLRIPQLSQSLDLVCTPAFLQTFTRAIRPSEAPPHGAFSLVRNKPPMHFRPANSPAPADKPAPTLTPSPTPSATPAPAEEPPPPPAPEEPGDGQMDPLVIICRTAPPLPALQSFDHGLFQSTLRTRALGRALMHGDVVTSTQKLLDENWMMTASLPEGVCVTANHQISARGRGRNVWVSPRGQLMFSVVVRHPLSAGPLPILQYIAALSVVHGVRSLPGYADLDLRIKWPNDIYIGSNGTADGTPHKVGGVLITTTVEKNEFVVVIGVGVNVANTSPSVGINQVIRLHNTRVPQACLSEMGVEASLAVCLNTMEELLTEWRTDGFHGNLHQLYTRYWLHGEQVVQVEGRDGPHRLVGIDGDGYLLARPADGVMTDISLEPDGNSFDMMNGLIYRKP